VTDLESKELDAGINLVESKGQIQNANQRLDSYHLSCRKEVKKKYTREKLEKRDTN
jgi:hypothetical protein